MTEPAPTGPVLAEPAPTGPAPTEPAPGPGPAEDRAFSAPHHRGRLRANWLGSQSSTPQYTVSPRSTAEVLEAVRYAVRRRMPVRPAGAGYSWSALAVTGGMLVETGELVGMGEVDPATARVWVRAGTTVRDLGDLLWTAGYSLTQQGFFDRQTIVGALTTGTHGSGAELGNLASFVRGVRVIDGRGRLVEITEDDPAELRAARLSLGMLGVIVEVLLQVEPRYHLTRQISFPTWDEALGTLEVDLAAHRHYSTMWSPADDSLQKCYQIQSPPGVAMSDRNLTFVFDKTDARHGEPSHHVLSARDGESPSPFHELEYAVPIERAAEAMTSARRLLRERHPEREHPLFFRFAAADDAYLSPFCGRDSITVSAGAWPDSGEDAFFDAVHHLLLADFDARPHWGKLFRHERADVRRLFPELPRFAAVRSEFDPHDLFLNDALRTLFA
ncbi:FAD-binding protein [Streptomyces sp. CA-111067]|uniref:FAD-binding protein n=1 Tax=Streptomyces sp. CA-111067 TaxID=3240046 RepID=UPI003D98CD0D